MTERALAYRLPLQCAGHLVSPARVHRDAEITIAGYSFCLPCGEDVMWKRLNAVDHATMTDILREYRDGVAEVSR